MVCPQVKIILSKSVRSNCVPAADGRRLHLVVLAPLSTPAAAPAAARGSGALLLHRLAPHAGGEALHVAAVLVEMA